MTPEDVTIATLHSFNGLVSGVQGGGPSSRHLKFAKNCWESGSRSSKRGIYGSALTPYDFNPNGLGERLRHSCLSVDSPKRSAEYSEVHVHYWHASLAPAFGFGMRWQPYRCMERARVAWQEAVPPRPSIRLHRTQAAWTRLRLTTFSIG